jgi:hypothetical protein
MNYKQDKTILRVSRVFRGKQKNEPCTANQQQQQHIQIQPENWLYNENLPIWESNVFCCAK